MRSVFPALWLSPRAVGLLLALALVWAAGTVVPWLILVGYGATIALAAAVIVDFRFGPTSRTLNVARFPFQRLIIGRSATVSYSMENKGTLSVRIGLLEVPPEGVRFDREVLTATIAANEKEVVEQTLIASERGRVRFGAFYLWAENAVGLLRRRFEVSAEAEVDVFPDLSAVERYGTLAFRRTLLEMGLRKLRLRGMGSEFESLRDYAPGDAFRSVDWKATARRGRLVVQQYEVERSQQVIIAFDCGRLMTARLGVQRKFDYALTAGLSVARLAQAADDHIGLTAFAARPILSIAPRRGQVHLAALSRAVFDLQPRFEEPDYERAFTELKSRHTKRSLIVFFTDIFDPTTSASVLGGLGLLAQRHVVLCVLMNDAAIVRSLAEEPRTVEEAFRAGVAMKLADERAAALAHLRSLGVIVVDVSASHMTTASLDAYLEVKARGRV